MVVISFILVVMVLVFKLFIDFVVWGFGMLNFVFKNVYLVDWYWRVSYGECVR